MTPVVQTTNVVEAADLYPVPDPILDLLRQPTARHASGVEAEH
jgi:hypothetical protein